MARMGKVTITVYKDGNGKTMMGPTVIGFLGDVLYGFCLIFVLGLILLFVDGIASVPAVAILVVLAVAMFVVGKMLKKTAVRKAQEGYEKSVR